MKQKLVFLGEQGCGKTSIITRFMYDTFDDTYQATIGIDFMAKTLCVNNTTVKLQLWDTAGQERFHSLIPSYIRDCSATVIVYDVTNAQTFAAVEKWIKHVQEERGSDALIAIAGNKCDSTDEKVVSTEEAELFAKKNNALFFETSAKNGDNIYEMFNAICEKLIEKKPSNDVKQTIEIALNEQSTKPKSITALCGC